MERYSRKVFVGGLPPDIDEGRQRITVIHPLPKDLFSAGIGSIHKLLVLIHFVQDRHNWNTSNSAKTWQFAKSSLGMDVYLGSLSAFCDLMLKLVGDRN